MSFVKAEYFGGPRDGEQEMIPDLVGEIRSVMSGGVNYTGPAGTIAYQLAADAASGLPLRTNAGCYRYEFAGMRP